MTDSKVYSGCNGRWRTLLVSIFTIFLLFSASEILVGQGEPEYDEILVFLEMPGVGAFDIPAVIKGEKLYLPVTDLFDFLKIRNVPEPDLQSISGFFIDPEASFLISRAENRIVYQDKTFNLNSGDLVRTESNLYLLSDYFGKIFGLECFFNFRSLAVTLNSKLELPLIKEMRQEEMRRNLTRLKGEMMADTVLKRTYPAFRFGMADWSVYASQEVNGRTDTRMNLALGAMLAGGEATASLYYDKNAGFNEKQQNYLWRYVDNENLLFRQVLAGKIPAQATSSIFNPVIGVQFTNTPTTYRRSFGTYTLSDRTEPGWVVELYVNNVLVDYVKADASGFFRFEVPLVYGNSIIRLKFYGPWGEEKVREQSINIPFNFLPEKTFEYKVSAGFVEDSSFSRFSRISLNYGLSRNITIGGGVEYLSSVSATPVMPYLNASWNLLNTILLSGEYTNGVRSKGTLSYRTPSNVQLELNYTKYVKGQKAIMYNYLEERKASISIPLRMKSFTSYNRFSVYQIILPSIRYSNGELMPSTTQYTTGEWMFSGSFRNIGTNLSTYAILIGETDPNIYSNLSLSLRLPASFVIMPQVQYGYTQKEFLSARLGLEKRIRENAFLNFTLEQNFMNNLKMAEFGFRYNFGFAQTGVSLRQSNKKTSFIEYARGSLIYDGKSKYLGADNQFNVGRGGISIIPYIDLNANGIRDKGEPKAYGLNIRSTGGRIEKNESDTTIRILGLEPYTSCFIDLDANSFENLAWRMPVKVLNVAVDPEIMKHIEIPVTVAGEASGNVIFENAGQSPGIGRIIVGFFNMDGVKVATTLTENDGYFTWFGLTPGTYSVRVDTSQLRKLGMSSDPVSREFGIKPDLNGDVVDGLDFTLRTIVKDTLKPKVIQPVQVTRMDTTVMIVHEVVEELVTITKDSWAIQLGAFKNRTNAETLRKKLEKLLGRSIDIIIQDGYFKVRINEIEGRDEVDRIVEVLRKNGITEIWIITLKARQQQVVLREKQDSVIQVYESKIFLPFTDDFYKLDRKQKPVIEQTVIERMESHTDLKKMKFREIRPMVRVTPVNQPEAPSPAETIRMIRGENLIEKVFIPEIPPLATSVEHSISAETAPPVVKVPEISLQVGVFYKKSEALKAQKKIQSRLNLPVKIVEQWEYYRVIITGFHSREETFMYYPELAGLGFPAVKLIEQ